MAEIYQNACVYWIFFVPLQRNITINYAENKH